MTKISKDGGVDELITPGDKPIRPTIHSLQGVNNS